MRVELLRMRDFRLKAGLWLRRVVFVIMASVPGILPCTKTTYLNGSDFPNHLSNTEREAAAKSGRI